MAETKKKKVSGYLFEGDPLIVTNEKHYSRFYLVTKNDKKFAAKVCDMDFVCSHNDSFAKLITSYERFRNCPHVIQCVETGQTQNKLYLFFKYFNKESLRNYLSKTSVKLSKSEIVEILTVIAKALIEIKNEGFTHSELTTDHVLVHEEDKKLSYCISGLKFAKEISKEITEHVGIKNLGLIAYELLTGSRVERKKRDKTEEDEKYENLDYSKLPGLLAKKEEEKKFLQFLIESESTLSLEKVLQHEFLFKSWYMDSDIENIIVISEEEKYKNSGLSSFCERYKYRHREGFALVRKLEIGKSEDEKELEAEMKTLSRFFDDVCIKDKPIVFRAQDQKKGKTIYYLVEDDHLKWKDKEVQKIMDNTNERKLLLREILIRFAFAIKSIHEQNLSHLNISLDSLAFTVSDKLITKVQLADLGTHAINYPDPRRNKYPERTLVDASKLWLNKENKSEDIKSFFYIAYHLMYGTEYSKTFPVSGRKAVIGEDNIFNDFYVKQFENRTEKLPDINEILAHEYFSDQMCKSTNKEGKEVTYYVLKKLGSGNSATASKYINSQSCRTYCLKKFGSDAERSFEVEHKLYQNAKCPYILNYYDTFEAEDKREERKEAKKEGKEEEKKRENRKSKYISLEVMDLDLKSYLDTKKVLPEKEIRMVAESVARAMSYLHDEKGIIHRDLKLENIFIKIKEENISQVKIADFGIAMEKTVALNTSYDAGSEFYMAPETIRDNKVSTKSDVWSFGIILLLISGNKLCDMAKISKYIESLDEDIGNMVSKCLSKDPKKRPEFSAILEDKYFKEKKSE